MDCRAAAFLIALSVAACGPSPTPTQEYPGPWTEPSASVLRTLFANQVQGCAEVFQRIYKNSPPEPNIEALVYCTRDGKTWASYKVWPGRGKVMGPDTMFPVTSGIPLPQSGIVD